MRRLSLSQRFGLSKTAVGSSLTLHVGIETALGGLIGVSLLFSKQTRATAHGILSKFTETSTVLLMLAVIGITAGLCFFISANPVRLPLPSNR